MAVSSTSVDGGGGDGCTSILAKNAMDVVSNGGRGGRRAPPSPAPCHTPPQQHVDCHFPFKTLRRCPPAPATPRPPTGARHRTAGVVALVAMAPSLADF
jgi:hypothetical protein